MILALWVAWKVGVCFITNKNRSSPPTYLFQNMLQLSRHTLLHDDPNSSRHFRDKLQKSQRDSLQFVPVESPIKPSGQDLTGIDFDAESAGFMLRFGSPKMNSSAAQGNVPLPPAEQVDPAEYRKWILQEERQRRRFKRTITRNGKTIETWGKHQSGGVSLVVTVPPWTMNVINLLEDDVRDNLLLQTAHVAAERLQEISGRTAWGAGCHTDTDVAHFHLQIPKTSPTGDNWPKSKFRTGGPWLTGANRVEMKFPGLLSKQQQDLLKDHTARKGTLVDLEMASAVDEFLESSFQQMGLQQEYELSCGEYVARKKKAQSTERDRLMLAEALKFFRFQGIWPLATSVMKLAIWRMLPKEIRPIVMQSIRLTQMIAAPIERTIVKTAAKEVMKRLSELREPVMAGPKR